MRRWKEIQWLLRKDFRSEFREPSAIASIGLYLVSTLYICYQSFRETPNVQIWSALLWIILLFSATHAVNRSFLQENRSRQVYYYSIVSPQSVILGKMLYNSLIILASNLLGYFLFSVFFKNPELDTWPFLPILCLGSTGIANLLTFVSAIASKSSQTSGMIGILSFPLILPLFLISIRATQQLSEGLPGQNLVFALGLFTLNAVVITLGYILFPYIWKE